MIRVTRFCVQPFERAKSTVRPGEPQQFYSEGEALSFARRIESRVAGVLVVRVVGWPVQELWDRPSLIRKVGEVPIWALEDLAANSVNGANKGEIAFLRR